MAFSYLQHFNAWAISQGLSSRMAVDFYEWCGDVFGEPEKWNRSYGEMLNCYKRSLT